MKSTFNGQKRNVNQSKCQKLSRDLEGKDLSPRQAVEPLEEYRQLAYIGWETGGRTLAEVLPIAMFGETGKQQVMALRDLNCNTTLR